MTEETAIAEAQPVRALVTPEQAKADWEYFLKLKSMLLTDDDYKKDNQGRPYIAKSGFRKIAVAFNLSDRILFEERKEREDKSFYWRVVIEVQAPNGRTATGVAICDSGERKFYHVEHDVYATAHTRAKNRAISDLVAGGVVSAEEMEPTEISEQPQSPPAPTRPKISPKTVPRKNSEERVFEFRGAGPESGPELKDDPHPF